MYELNKGFAVLDFIEIIYLSKPNKQTPQKPFPNPKVETPPKPFPNPKG